MNLLRLMIFGSLLAFFSPIVAFYIEKSGLASDYFMFILENAIMIFVYVISTALIVVLTIIAFAGDEGVDGKSPKLEKAGYYNFMVPTFFHR